MTDLGDRMGLPADPEMMTSQSRANLVPKLEGLAASLL